MNPLKQVTPLKQAAAPTFIGGCVTRVGKWLFHSVGTLDAIDFKNFLT